VSKVRIITATLLALALAAPAMAFDVQIKGDFNNRFGYTENSKVTRLNSLSNEAARYANVAELDNPGITNEEDSDASEFFAEAKYRLHFIGTDDEKKVKGVIGLELGASKYGNTDGSGKGFQFGGDGRDTLELQYAYTDFELPFYKEARLSLGLQPVGLNKWVWSDNAAGVKLNAKYGDLGYQLSWFRNDYKFTTVPPAGANKEEARDVYALDVKYTPQNLPKFNLFAIYSWEDEAALTTAGNASKDTEIWLGAAIDGQAGPLFYGATAIYLTGEAEGGALTQDLDRKAYFLNAEATYKAGKSRIKGGWMYASGDDDSNDGDLENYDVIDVYVPIGSVVIFDSYADDNTAATSPYVLDKGYNLLYLAIDHDLSDKTTVGASWFWHNTAEDLTVEGDKDLGNEIAVRAAHKVTKNLTAGIQAGYLFGGDAWEDLGTATDDGDDIFVTDASIRLMF
jgi:hypothetical protein